VTRNKSLIIALTDFKQAMKVRYVKYSFYGTALLGPILVVMMVGGPLALIPSTSSDYPIMVSMMIPLGSAILALMEVIPAGLISANALVGEKEQRTLEPLLVTPLTDRQLLWGKVLGSLIPCVILLYGGTAVTAIAINVLLLVMGNPLVLFPDPPGMFLIFVVGPIVALAIISTMILISGKVSRVYEAYQMGSVAVLVLMIPLYLPMMQFSGSVGSLDLIWLSDLITFAVALVLASLTWALAIKRFNRDQMVTQV